MVGPSKIPHLTTYNTHKRQTSKPLDRFEPGKPSKRAAADPRLRQRGHWDRQLHLSYLLIVSTTDDTLTINKAEITAEKVDGRGAWLNDPQGYAGGSVANGRASHVR